MSLLDYEKVMKSDGWVILKRLPPLGTPEGDNFMETENKFRAKGYVVTTVAAKNECRMWGIKSKIISEKLYKTVEKGEKPKNLLGWL